MSASHDDPPPADESVAPTVGISDGDAKREATLEDCLTLLRSPSDEKRFVALLLLSKLLKAGDLAAVKAVFDGVEDSFLNRLLRAPSKLGEKGAQGGGGVAPARQMQMASALAARAVAVTLCSVFVRLPELAREPALLERVPLFLGILSEPLGAQAADVHTMLQVDALECLLGVVGASAEGRLVCLQSGGLRVLAGWLPSLEKEAAPGAAPGTALGAADGAQALAPAVLAVQMMALLLAGEDGRAHFVDPEGAKEALEAVRVLARTLDGAHGTVAQLEALHALLHLYPLPPDAVRLHALLMADAEWAEALRGGVAAVLGSSVPQAQRHAAIRLVAFAVAVKGPHWLAQGPDGGGAFLKLAITSVKVEVVVGLHALARDDTPDIQSEALLCTCYAVLEAFVAMLAQSQEGEEEDQKGGEQVAAGTGREEGLQLDDEMEGFLFGTLHDIMGVVLEFLEDCSASAENGDREREEGGTAGAAALVVASARVIGCFLAQVPEAFAGRMPGLLEPLLTTAAAAGAGGTAMGFMLPYLCQATQPSAATRPAVCAALLCATGCIAAVAELVLAGTAALHSPSVAAESGHWAVQLEDAALLLVNVFRHPDALTAYVTAAAAAASSAVRALATLRSVDVGTALEAGAAEEEALTPAQIVLALQPILEGGLLLEER